MKLFRENRVDHKSKWDKFFPILNKDQRFQIIVNYKDRKKLFKEFVHSEK